MSTSESEPVEVTAACIVLDIEGTTSPTSAVLGTLYDYARPRLGAWISAHGDDPVVRGAVADVRREGGLPDDAPVEDLVRVLHGWMDSDVKATSLKTLQGQIWAEGFAAGDLKARVLRRRRTGAAGVARVRRPAGVVLVGIRRQPAALVPAYGRRRPVRPAG